MERGQFFKETVFSQPKRGWHNLSFDNTFSCNAGKLYPTKCLEIFPGDIIHDSSSGFARLMPLVAPVMGKLNLFSYHFIVRNRDIWTQWDKFITNANQKKTWQQNLNFTPPAMPYIDVRQILYYRIYINATGNPTLPGQFQNVYHICCGTKNGASVCFKAAGGTEAMNFLLDTSISDKFYFVFIPNKQDGAAYYNPFGAGTLLDFLGINIDGFFANCASHLELSLSPVFNHHTNAVNGITWPWTYQDSGASNLGSTYSDDQDYPITQEWFEDHMCLFFGYSYDDDAQAIHWEFADGFSHDVGNTTINDHWYMPPFDPSTDDQYDWKLCDLSLRAYRFIYDEYFRDENYMEVNLNTDFSRDGNDLDWFNVPYGSIWNYLTYAVKSYEHDLYTTALPQAQKGNPVRFLPDADIKLDSTGSSTSGGHYLIGFESAAAGSVANVVERTTNSYYGATINVDLSAATIENLRFYNAMQKYLELKARTGSRYYEYMIGQWGYEIEDSKLNRPIYLSGTRTPVQISEVTQTSASDPSTGQPLGDLAGRGVAIGEDDRIDFTSPDYGFLIEICSLVPRTSYGQGIKPMFKRFTYMDYPLPGFANLGEESIKKRELYATLKKSDDDATFGYSCRYYQFKYERDQVHGDMLTSLRHWNFARFFDGVPFNGPSFLEVNPSYRQFAVTDKNEDHFLVTMWHDIQINRALPELSIPSL